MKKLLTCLLLLPTLLFSQAKMVSVNLYQGNNLMDGCLIVLNGQSDKVDLFDQRKITNPAANIAIINGKDTLASEQRTSYATIPLYLWNLKDSSYRLQIFTKNMNNVFLQDGGKYTLVTDTLKYYFTGNKASISRFKIYLCTVLSIPEVSAPVRPNQTGAQEYTIINMLGQTVDKVRKLPAGAYRKVNNSTYIKITQ